MSDSDNKIRILSAVTGAPMMDLHFDGDSQNIVSPVTGRKIGTVDPDTPISGGGADVSGVTATAGDVDASKKFVTADGVLTDGTLATVSPPAPTVSVNSGTGLVTAAYTPVAGRVKDTTAKSSTLQLAVKAAAAYTPTTSDQTIDAGRYLTGAQTIKGDAALLAGNIKSGVTIFGVIGSHAGGGAFDLVKVTAFTPAQVALTAVSSIALSGMGAGEMGDYTAYNGTYNVTAATEREADPLKRVFKHSTDNKYLFWFDYYGTGYWVLSTSASITDIYEAVLYYSSSSALTSATNTWYSEMGESQSVTATVTSTEYPAVSLVLNGVKATEYNALTHVWTFDTTSNAYTSYEKTPKVYGIFAAVSTALIGERIASYAGPIPTTGLVFYAPLSASAASAETGQTLTKSGTVSFSGGAMVVSGSGKITFDAGSSAPTGTNAVTLSIWYNGSYNSSSDEFLFGYGSTPFDSTVVALLYKNGEVALTGWGSGSSPLASGVRIDDNTWHHIAVTLSNNSGAIYIDGELVASGACPISIGGTDGAIGGAFWDSGNLSGAIRAARIYNSVLSAQDIAALSTEF